MRQDFLNQAQRQSLLFSAAAAFKKHLPQGDLAARATTDWREKWRLQKLIRWGGILQNPQTPAKPWPAGQSLCLAGQ
jgi:hypothetical protein